MQCSWAWNTLKTATQTKAKDMAAPHILVSDNREARIQVGQQVPIVTSETIASAGVPAQRTVQYRDIGIILKVKPRVNEGGLVAMDIAQEVSTYSTIKLYVDSTEIILNKTEATTNLVVQDGQTIVIGGLIREDTSRTRTGLPFLTKIPWLGWLFGDTDDDESRQEIIILLTPHVIKSAEAAREMTSEIVDRYSRTGKGQVPKEDLMKSLIPATPVPPGEELPR
jgi:general secretion pathway protein D